MTEKVISRFDPALVDAYQRDGAVCIRGLFDADQVALLKSGIDDNIAHPSPRSKVASRPDDPGWFMEDFCNWNENEAYRHFIFDTGVGEVAGKLMKSKQTRLHHDHMLVKEPGTRQRTPWHQDQPYYNIDGHQNVSMWIPVDSVSRESTLEFVAGSHKGPWLMPQTFMDKQAKWFPEGSLEHIPDIQAHREDYKILGWPLEPGDVVVFNMLTLHASGGVSGQNRRRAFSIRFIGDDITFAPRRWTTSPPFPGINDELREGDSLNHRLFPLLVE